MKEKDEIKNLPSVQREFKIQIRSWDKRIKLGT